MSEKRYGNQCSNPSCRERRPRKPNNWWQAYDTCSRDCTVDYYGPEVLS